jgi:hypothetical protein
LSAGLVSGSFGLLRNPPGDGFSGTLEQVLGHVALPVGGNPGDGLWDRLAQSLLDHPGVGEPGVRQGDEELFSGGLGDEIHGAQGVERAADILLLPAALYEQGQRGERQVKLVGDGGLLPKRLLERLRGL